MSMTLASLLPDQSLPAHLAALQVTGLALDSREVAPGNLFFALPGPRTDGRRFIDAAIDAGAGLVIEDGPQPEFREQQSTPVLTVPDLVRHLGVIAARYHGDPAAHMNMVGITGTNGKSSVAWFLHDAFNALGQSCALIGTLGARMKDWSVPGTHTTPDAIRLQALLENIHARGADTVVMEVSSHALVQQRLNGVPFSSAVFTNLSRDHLDYHGDMDSYFDAKARLFDWPGLAIAVINTGDHWGQRLVRRLPSSCRCVTYGSDDSDVRCLDSRFRPEGMELQLDVGGHELALVLPLFGAFNRDNVMAVAGLLHAQGISGANLASALSAITAVPGRMQPLSVRGAPTVVVDYAHTPDALEKALRACRQHFSGRLWCVVGCGGDRDPGKRPQMAAAACELADEVIFTSDNPRSESPQDIIDQMLAGVPAGVDVQCLVDRAEAIALAVASAAPDDLLLVAGKGHEDYQEIAGQRLPFDDASVAHAALQQRQLGGGQ